MSKNNHYESNELIDRLPKHLKQFIKPQNYEDYTPINQAVWRYVMKKCVSYLADVAHESYLKGLEQTGVGIERIPSMYGMNRILKEIGWAAVSVDGFIPPNAFMEFQANKILVIASDIRQLEHIEYTPAPDIIHESAGHAPIIANPDYAEYLRRLGEIGAKAILSKHDMDVYEAVRELSILKEAEGISQEKITRAEDKIHELQNMKVALSEMGQIRNLQWWTVEYGLIGDIDNPKIYGAGLLSSIGESKSCLSNSVKKIPYSIAAAYQEFDITKSQPQLYVTPDFSYLMLVLEEFSNTLSIRKGGRKGLQKLIDSQLIGTIELSTGLQVSGKFSKALLNEDNEVIFFKTEGPTALAFREKELIGHGIDYYNHGFSSPLGKLKNINLAIEDMGPVDLKAYNFYDGKWLSFEFESGIKVEGLNVTGIRNVYGKLMLIQLKDCTVTYKEETLFLPEYGVFDMVIGKEIVSAFSGTADSNSFPNLYEVSATKTIKQIVTESKSQLEGHYAKVAEMRNNGLEDDKVLAELFTLLKDNYPKEWLLHLEISEISNDEELAHSIHNHLEKIIEKFPQLKTLITDGIEIAKELPLTKPKLHENEV
ncbi:aromatic amino acid hydroxylase [Bizionia argentinensis JUB59]|uniref:Aromatic amino acid hydroxylase n=1 Tax=Bizionia argentinensis JUB59 TaxID=1046627 RepID=G2ECE2_9FLAO|nr:aromatic amino acid hydroxylase [Bizionia argentinensis]EGV43851.1 aromatic amino acid hydroxylase [Bizionia argentinensis JUB59]